MSASVEFEAEPLLSYSHAHNRVPVVRSIAIHNRGAAATGCDLVVEVSDSEGVLGSSLNIKVDLEAGETTWVRDASIRLDPAALLQVTERRPGMVKMSLRRQEDRLAAASREIQVLAANQWLLQSMPLSFELLASFVQPNDPNITQLLSSVSELLREQTGSSSLEGYQSGPERVEQIVRAVYDAMQLRRIIYAEPPASWADQGQKIRTPTEVLEERVGTCLDTTVVFAAALEQCGIHPLLWVVQGHAFVGYWRTERSFDAVAMTEAHELANLVDLGFIGVVETTALTDRGEPVDFDLASRLPVRGHLQADLERVLACVDVRTARTSGIVPLPARRRTSTGVEIHEYVAASHSRAPEVTHRRPPTDVQPGQSSKTAPPARIQQWKNALLDLSLRNRLINFTERARMEVRVPEGKLPELEDLLHANRPLSLVAQDAIDQIHGARGVRSGFDLSEDSLRELLEARASAFVRTTSETYQARMRALAYKARTIEEETGANNLYLTVGELVWDLDGRSLRSPLILVPVRLQSASRGRAYRLALDESGGSTPNYCLLEKLKQDVGLQLPGLENLVEDDHGVDVGSALASVRTTLAERGLPYRVEETASVAILQFAKFRLWKDLDEHWERLVDNSLVKHLVHTPTDEYDDGVVPADTDLDVLDASCPIPADASQLAAVADAVAGRTFVLEGPPGTGKSQTITNLLTRAIAEGRRVLFVAEKRAALDVVSARLAAVGMGPFCLDLHDKGSKPATVRAQVKRALEHQVGVDADGLQAHTEDLAAARRSLARYARRLHEKNTAGQSYYGARAALLARGEGPVLEVPRAVIGLPAERHAEIRSALRALPDVADEAGPGPQHPWAFVSVGDDARAEAIHDAARRFDESLRALASRTELQDSVGACRRPEDFRTLSAVLTHAPEIDVLDETRTERWKDATRALTAEVAAFVAASHPGLDRATPAALSLPLADIHARAEAAAASGFFGRKKRLLSVVEELRPALRDGAAIRPKELVSLTGALLQVQGAVRALATRAGYIPGLRVPESWNPLTPQGQDLVERQVSWLDWAGTQVDSNHPSGPDFLAALRSAVAGGARLSGDESRSFEEAGDALEALVEVACSGFDELAAWIGAHGVTQRWNDTAARRGLDDSSASALRRWMAFRRALEPIRKSGAQDAWTRLLSGQTDAEDAQQAWERGLAAASLAERRESTGLDAFDPAKHDKTVERFTAATAAVRGHMSAEVPRQVLENRPFQSRTSRGQVGALQRELSRQRGGLGVRALLSTYGDLVTQVMPCVLVSPDSAARFFPVGTTTFDMVVFDEASQVRVADAVGAMGRSRSVVIVGDSKQMPPTTFGEGSESDEGGLLEEMTTVADQESILSEANDARVPRRWLTWHYRSQDESLIAFSNAHYYEGKLSSFPAPVTPESARDRGLGVSLRRVEGTFQRGGVGKLLRTNPVEAEAIVAEIRERFDQAVGVVPSLGVVTFNQQQRAYIEALLRDTEDDRIIQALDDKGAGEGLFVKNLENVQGDERDVIFFSTAFSVNDKGVLPLNFGPLTRSGGERRLNVAVTRARRQVIIFSSFEPSQLRAEETQSRGIKHLRSYLDMAAGADGLAPAGSISGQVVDRHRDDVARALRGEGLVVRTDVGLSDFRLDLTIAHPDDPASPLVAVLLDGPGWADRRTVGDRDGLPSQVLRRLLKWPAVERVWMPTWLDDRDQVVKRLVTSVDRARAGQEHSGVAEAQAPKATPVWDVVDDTAGVLDGGLRSGPATMSAAALPAHDGMAEEPDTLPGQSTFDPWTPGWSGDRSVLDALPATWASAQVGSVLQRITEQEGPIHLDRLAKLAAAEFDLTRVSADRGRSILGTLPARCRRGPETDFAWPPGLDPDTWTGFRVPGDGESRPVEQVALRELANIMVALCEVSAGVASTELGRETLQVLGGRRMTPGVTSRLQDALRVALESGRLIEDDAGVLRPRRS